MKFKVTLEKEPKHSELVSCVGWSGTDELYSCGEDHVILCWSQIKSDTTKVTDLYNDLYPTDMHWFPKSVAGGGAASKKLSSSSDLFVLTAADGKFHFISKNGRVEKTIDGHKGAVLCGRWSFDATALLTGGEDGLIKIWSRSGMLRSTLASNSNAVYHAVWGPDSTSVLYTQDRNLIIKPLQPNSKPLQWKAHDGLILKVDWNVNSGLIVSGAEDCKYKVWDGFGRQLYASQAYDYPVTSVSWAPDGQTFAVGSFNTLRLCDKAGWCHSLEKPNTGSIFNISWSSDGTQLAGACGNGHVLFAHVIERSLQWKNYEATIVGRKTIDVHDVLNGSREKLEFGDSIIKMCLSHGHLVVTSATQCYLYSTKNWNTPIIFDLKEGNVNLVLLSQKHFLIVETLGMYVYSYEGRLVCTPKWQGMRPDILNTFIVSLSNDTLAVRDRKDEKVVLLFDTQSGKPVGDGKPFCHKMDVSELSLDQCGSSNERRLAIVDKNRDLYIVPVRTYSSRTAKTIKIGAMIQSFCWHDSTNMLSAIHDNKLSVWYYPSTVYVDKNLLNRAVSDQDASEYGKNPQIVSFVGNHISIRRADGALVSMSISPYPSLLHNYVLTSRWEDAVRICRFVKDESLWSCLAGMAAYNKELNTAEVAYAAIEEVDKVQYIDYIKSIPIKEIRSAEMMLFCGQSTDAEVILLQSGHIFRAIMTNIQQYNWDRALELAVKHKTHLDTVLAFRKKYLKQSDRKEVNKRFVQYSTGVEIDWDQINERIEAEYANEKDGNKLKKAKS